MTDVEIRKLLGLADDADISGALVALQAKAAEVATLTERLTAETERANASGLKLSEQEADALVAVALEAKKILPKQQEWAKTYCLADRAGFDAYVESAAPIGPEAGEHGNAGDTKAGTLTATERKIAKKMGVTEEMLLKEKEREAAAEVSNDE